MVMGLLQCIPNKACQFKEAMCLKVSDMFSIDLGILLILYKLYKLGLSVHFSDNTHSKSLNFLLSAEDRSAH